MSYKRLFSKKLCVIIIMIFTFGDMFSQTDENCIDFTDLNSYKVTCRYGTFSHPDLHIGQITDRHHVNTNKNEKDPFTNNKLKVIPDGENQSVRLGNKINNTEAESVTYEFTVDTNSKDLLILKYAAVLEDAGHSAYDQPRFTFSILNSNMQLIDQCYFANFVASTSLGWNYDLCYGKGMFWKDWTTIGVDLSNFHEQTIYVKLTTYDCAHGGHRGYAYFTLNCAKKVMLTENCGATVENTFTAPDGFNYTWYKTEEPTNILSTDKSLHVTEQGEYLVKCSFVGKSECYFLMSAYAGERYPFARYDYEIIDTNNCTTKVKFTNKSIVTNDSTHQSLTTQKCDSFLWDFGDGTVSTEENPTHVYNETNYNNSYKVQLIAYLSNGKCSDTIIKTIQSQPCQIDTIDIGLCPKEYIVFNDTIILKDDGTYQIDSFEYRKIVNIFHYPQYDTLIKESICYGDEYNKNGFNVTTAGYYTDSLKSVNGCDSIVHLLLTTNPTYDLSLFDTICNGEIYSSNGFNGTTTGTYVQNLQTIKGCDSIVTLNLIVNPTFDSTYFDTICQGDTSNVYNFSETKQGVYIQNLKTINGCDSIVRLNLKVNPVYDTTISAEICDGEYYTQYNFNEKEQGEYVQELKSIHSCDSIIHLKLQVNPIFDTLIYDTICANEYYTLYNFNENITGTYVQNLSTIKGCDSIVTLELFVHPIYDTIYFDTICDKDTCTSYNFSETSAGFYTQELQSIYGCDSIVRLNLKVNPVYDTTISAEICNGEFYTQYNFNEKEQGEYVQELKSIHNCDSIIHLKLQINPTFDTLIYDTICANEYYTLNNFNENIAGTYVQNLQTIKGCDSIVTLELFVHPIYDTIYFDTICDKDTCTSYNFSETSAGFYTQELQSIYGCDSIIHLDLAVNEIYSINIEAEICDGDTYSQNNFIESVQGEYIQELQTINGCDSIVTLNLIVRSIYDTIITADICEGETYNENNFIQTAEGIYTDSLNSEYGCDSIVHLALFTHPLYYDTIIAEICSNENYSDNDFDENTQGIYDRHLTTIWGCDSIITLDLTVHQAYYDTIEATIAEGKIYDRYGFYASDSGTYSQYATTINGCDSI